MSSEQETAQNGNLSEQEKNLRITCTVLAGLMGGGLAVAGFSQPGFHAGIIALLWALACLAVGCVGGFLFAVPRASRSGAAQEKPQPDKPEGGAAAAGKSSRSQEGQGTGLSVNTNLEEISDWLTKIFVGLGLFELRKLPGFIYRGGEYVGQCLGTGNHAAASGLIIYFSGLGFLSGYLLTRLFLSPAFQLADRATRGLDEKLKEAVDEAKTVASAAVDQAKTLATAAVDEAKMVASAAVDQAKMVADENAKIREDRENTLRPVENDINAAMLELAKNPPDRSVVFIDQLIQQLQNHLERFPLHRRLNLVLARLYAEGKQSRQRAVDILRAFIAKKEQAKERDADLADGWFNLACYYSLLMGMAPAPEKEVLEGKALQAVEESAKIEPANGVDLLGDKDMAEFWKSASGQSLRQKIEAKPAEKADPRLADANGADTDSADANHDEKLPSK